MNRDVHRLDPAFDFTSCESSVLLYQGQTELRIDGNTYTGDGEVRLDLLPRANIHLYGKFQGVPAVDALAPMTGQKTISSFSINGRPVDGFLLSIGGDATAQEMTIKWRPKSEPINGVGDESTQMTRVVFHLFNFADLLGIRKSIEQSGAKRHRIEHVDLIGDECKVELTSLLATKDNIKALKAEGGYRLTHIGGLEKADGTSFSGKDADECLKALRFFLSFAKGSWCDPTCAVGFDASGNRVWESWSSPRDQWHTSLSWFDPHNSSQLAMLFQGFMERWVNDDWRDALHEVIYWYLNANHSSRGIDAGIILTQAAIERLSYEFSVKDRRLLTVNGFKDLWASDKFRLLFSSMNIPLDIPAETSELQRLGGSSQMNWLDAPHALSDIRNSLVHPEHKRRGQVSSVYYEAWNLGLWYLEMGILAICGYSGTYGNRLKQRWVGQVEDVPWKK
ncbi:MAG: hypothetical protein ACOZF2_07115 [Thermodesulfobacteriota bacterium]